MYNLRGDFMTVVVSQVAILVLFASVGFILAKTRLINADHSKILSTLLVYVFLPCNLFKSFATNFNIKYIKENYFLILTSLCVLAVLILISHFLTKLLTKDSCKGAVYKYSLTVPNYGYMGYALTESIFGSGTLLSVMMFGLPLSIYIYTYGYCILTKSPLKLKKLINPVTIAIFAGMAVGLSGLKLPEFVNGFLTTAAAPMGITSMLLTGITVSQYKLKELINDKTNYIVVFLRLLLFPCAIAFILKTFVSADAALVALMIYAMPCGLNTVVFPKLVGEDCRTGASLALISSILSILTIPLCLYLFT